MLRSLLAALILASGVSSARAAAMSCAPNPELDAKAFALWITNETNPDAAPCAARLALASCSVTDAGEARTYASADGRYAVALRLANGAVAVSLKLSGGASGVTRGGVDLATFPYHRVFYKGIGADAVTVFDQASQQPRAIGNVMLIPAENLTPNGAAMCPAN